MSSGSASQIDYSIRSVRYAIKPDENVRVPSSAEVSHNFSETTYSGDTRRKMFLYGPNDIDEYDLLPFLQAK